MTDPILFFALGALCVLVVIWAKARFWSFAAQRSQHYAKGGPQFDLREHLRGPILCEGVIYGPLGRVTSRFVGKFEAHWDGNRGVMREHFIYDSGATQDREWRLELGNDGNIKAEADDLVRPGHGQMCGSAVQLNYTIRMPEDAGGHVLDTVDWMYLAPNGTIINRSQFRKFGVPVAELVATMRRVDAV